MKDALFYTIATGRYGWKHEIMAVTSEKGEGTYRHRLYGRDKGNFPTNTFAKDSYGRFDTVDEAQAHIGAIEAVKAQVERDLKPLNDAIASIRQRGSNDIEAILKKAKAS